MKCRTDRFESLKKSAGICAQDLHADIHVAYRTPTLLISSAKDKLLGSLQEGARLERLMGNAMRIVLPRSGHTALLEVR